MTRRFGLFLTVTFVLGFGAGWMVWGPRLPLPKSVPDAVATIIEQRCVPFVRYRLPFNHSGLVPADLDYPGRQVLSTPDQSLVVLVQKIPGSPRQVSCSVTDELKPWSVADRTAVMTFAKQFGERWVPGEEPARDISEQSGHQELVLFRETDSKSDFVMAGFAPVSGDVIFTHVIIGHAVFNEERQDA